MSAEADDAEASAVWPMPVQPEIGALVIVTTTNSVEGRAVAEYLGVVTAQSVLGVNAFKDVAANVRNVFGGRSRSYENELGAGVASTLEELEAQAAKFSADAVLSVDIDYETVGNSMLMVSASGTAVRLR